MLLLIITTRIKTFTLSILVLSSENVLHPNTSYVQPYASKCNLLKVSSEPLRACREGDKYNDIANRRPDREPDKLSVSAARQVALCAMVTSSPRRSKLLLPGDAQSGTYPPNND